jgi:hypothetical protein
MDSEIRDTNFTRQALLFCFQQRLHELFYGDGIAR